ncbi:MAG: V-type ATP synthase subunit C [Bacillota bacterium]
MDNDRYAYAVGRIRAMETSLLDRGKIERMVEASGAEEALKVLGESEYAEYIASLASVYDYETMLDQVLHRVYRELRRFAPDPELVGLFACRYDYHNLKVLFKAYKMGEERDELLVRDVGNIPLTVLQRAVHDDDYRSLPRAMRDAAKQIAEALRLEANPQLVDLLLDRAMFTEMVEISQQFDSPFLHDYLAFQIDLLNVKTYLRVKRANLSREFLEQALLPLGRLDLTKLVQLADPPEVLADRLLSSSYASFMEEAIQSFQKTDTLTRFEKLVDDFLLEHVKKAKYVAFGLEPLAAFILAKENEVKLIRIIMVGKINRLPVEEIKERLRDVYV